MNQTSLSQRWLKPRKDCLLEMMNRLVRNMFLLSLNTCLLNRNTSRLMILKNKTVLWIPSKRCKSLSILSVLHNDFNVSQPYWVLISTFFYSLRDLESATNTSSSASSDDSVVHSTTDSPESPPAPPPITTDPIVILPRLSPNSLVSIVLFSLQCYFILSQNIQV